MIVIFVYLLVNDSMGTKSTQFSRFLGSMIVVST